MKAGLGQDFDSPIQESLHVDQHGTKRQTGLLGRKRYKQINIARIPGILPGHGPEYTYVPDAVTFG